MENWSKNDEVASRRAVKESKKRDGRIYGDLAASTRGSLVDLYLTGNHDSNLVQIRFPWLLSTTV